MSNPEPYRVLLAEGSDPVPLAWLRERADVLEISPDDPAFSRSLREVQGFWFGLTPR